jgi:2-amino-4-hydroxy-6-hydroxymethyldihydropteridine diphosphokinase
MTSEQRQHRPCDVIIALGGNIGDVAGAFMSALRALRDGGCTIKGVSDVYRTPAWGKTDQADFLNMAACLRTTLSPLALLALCQGIEQAHGRARKEVWGPRTVDLDIIDYDGQISIAPELILPHPHAHERDFVLVPMRDIAPALIINGKSVMDWLSGLRLNAIMRNDAVSEKVRGLLRA